MEIYGQNLASDGGNSRIHFDVPAGRRAVVDSVTKVKPADSYYGNPIAFKWGAGDLDLRLAVEDGSVMGLFTVREGTLGLTFAVPQTTLGKTIEVDANACLRLTAGTNRVNLAKVKFEKDTTLNTVANELGGIPCFEVTNDPEDGFNKGGTIVISGNLSRLGAGDYPLWTAPTISAGTAAKWNVRFEDPDHPAKVSSLAAHARLDSTSGTLRLHVERSGMAVIVK